MLFRLLHRWNVPSDVAYGAGILSIFGSILTWAVRNRKDSANAEHLAIFVGLWAPTFMIMGNALQQLESHKGMPHAMESGTQAVEDTVDGARQRVGALRP